MAQPPSLSDLLNKTVEAVKANPSLQEFHSQVALDSEALIQRIERLTSFDDNISLKTEMDDLREALLHNTAAAALLPPSSISLLVQHVRKIQGKLIEANASKKKEAKPKADKPKRLSKEELLAMAAGFSADDEDIPD